MQKIIGNEQKHVIFGIGLLLLFISIVCIFSAVLGVSHWVFQGFETELHAILRDIGILSLVAGLFYILAAGFFNRDPIRKFVHGAIINFSLILGGLVFTYIVLEVVLHLKYRDVQIGGLITPSRYTFYKKYYHWNEAGFRDTHHSLRKPEGTFRIVVVGDSFTFGAGVKRVEDLYFKILEKKLQQIYPQQTIEVVSIARKGWNTGQEFYAFRKLGIQYDPDLVILGYVLNDGETPALKEWWSRKFHKNHLLPYPYGMFLYANSFAYCIIEQKLKALPFFSDEKHSQDAYIKAIYSGDNLREHETILREFLIFIKAQNMRVVVVLFPNLTAIQHSDYPYLQIHEFVARTVRGVGAEFLDLFDALKKSSLPTFTVSEFDGHPNEEVHRITGTELFNVIARNALLPKSILNKSVPEFSNRNLSN